jgi:hypothetical protein
VKRIPRSWTETCQECHGTGRVTKREHFALWTPEEYPTDIPISPSAKGYASSEAYVCVAVPGASIFEACKEGVAIAKVVGRPVAFECNGAIAVCLQHSDPNSVALEWWKLAYGETYEQSAAKR